MFKSITKIISPYAGCKVIINTRKHKKNNSAYFVQEVRNKKVNVIFIPKSIEKNINSLFHRLYNFLFYC